MSRFNHKIYDKKILTFMMVFDNIFLAVILHNMAV